MVVDANVLFSALVRDSGTRKILVSGKIRALAPEYLLSELAEHKSEMLSKSALSRDEFDDLVRALLAVVTVIEADSFSMHLKTARRISPDVDDAPYLALCLARRISLWSNDVALGRQKMVRVHTTADLVAKLGL